MVCLSVVASNLSAQTNGRSSELLPFAQAAAKAGTEYHGDGLSMTATPYGVRLRCIFQRLEGRVTPEGLALVSTVESRDSKPFRVVAHAVGRSGSVSALPPRGDVAVAHELARCRRGSLTEEYSVSVEGVRQDFVVAQRPDGEGALRVELQVTGARTEALAYGARLVLAGSGRRIAYHRLRVADAKGAELAARLEVATERRVTVVVEDESAVYPVRIDPTFSDWKGA